MKIKLINADQYNTIKGIQEKNTALTFQNSGYEYIKKDKLSPEDKEALNVVTNILKDHIGGFSEFNNFNLKEGKIKLRVQYDYSHDDEGIPFIGVGYLFLDELLNGFEN